MGGTQRAPGWKGPLWDKSLPLVLDLGERKGISFSLKSSCREALSLAAGIDRAGLFPGTRGRLAMVPIC